VISSPTRIVPPSATRAPTPSIAARSALIVRSTSRSFAIPPGCGRVVMTHRSICLTTSSSVVPMATQRPTRASSSSPPSVSTTTLLRNCRGSQSRIAVVDMIDRRVLVESWNVPYGPSQRTHGEPASSSASSAISYVPWTSGAARRSSMRRPSHLESAASSTATAPSGKRISTSSTRHRADA